jgi:FkbM family methyltransferase
LWEDLPNVNSKMSKLIRTAQTYFPWLVDTKYSAQQSYRRALKRPFEPDFLALKGLDIGQSPLCLDVGANRGQSIEAIRLVRPSARIQAFEPNARLAERLKHAYSRDPQIEIYACGLGATRSSAVLHIPAYNGFVFDGLASLTEEAAREWLPSRILRFDPRKLEIRQVRCEIVPLDALGLRPSFIKIDVQGSEMAVISGGLATIRASHPVMLVESPGQDICELLSDYGYRPNAWRDGTLVQDELGSPNTIFQ